VTRTTPQPTALFRSPRRITVTLAYQTFERLQQRCDSEGRSLSNLAAFLLEMGLQRNTHDIGAAIPAGPSAASPARP